MQDKAYSYLDWPAIEGIIYAEEKYPREILAPRAVREGILYQCFFPGAESVRLVETSTGKKHVMVTEDEAGYFACVLPGRKVHAHTFLVDGEMRGDPYAHGPVLQDEDASRFTAGIAERAYRYLGAHEAEDGGEKGLSFALWAPGAVRASVVGPFNNWDGRALPMEYHEESGIFELFVPGLGSGTEYKYELRLATGLVYTRPDPFATGFTDPYGAVSFAADLSYRWHDREYLTRRSEITDTGSKPVSIYECSLESWKQRAEDPAGVTYRELAHKISSYVKTMGFTHVELKPVMEYADDASSGYQTTGYFAPTSRYGSPADFKYFVDTMHEFGIGVILDWTPAGFSPDTAYLASFDGTGLYEHIDPRQGIHPLWRTRLFNHGRPEVRSFLYSNAVFWMREYHADGLRVDGGSTMLRLDYARGAGQWVPNIYGAAENLEGEEFLRNLSRIVHRSFPDGILILEESVDRPEVTGSPDEGGLGFDYKWNLHFTEDMIGYLGRDAAGRRSAHGVLQSGMLHHYFDRFILSLSRGIGAFDRKRFMDGVDGSDMARASLIRAAYGYLVTHPGKKLFTDGEDFGEGYLAALLSLYRSEPALYELDYSESGFEWINTMDSEHSVLTFLRKSGREEETLVVVCNFSDENYPLYRAGVPYPGKYKEILNSDSLEFGGSGKVNPRARITLHEPQDERDETLRFRIAPRSIAVFRYQGR